jgi:hypothetical protein
LLKTGIRKEEIKKNHLKLFQQDMSRKFRIHCHAKLEIKIEDSGLSLSGQTGDQ